MSTRNLDNDTARLDEKKAKSGLDQDLFEEADGGEALVGV